MSSLRQAFAAQASAWAAGGVRILGGCCGLGVEHIRALTARLRQSSR